MLKQILSILLFLPVFLNSQATVVEIIVNSPNHNTLEAAVLAAGLETTLSGDGPFTVFAPTDDAFAALPVGTVEALLEDPTGALTDILLYHAVAGEALSGSLSNGQMITTINGKDVVVSINADGVFINNAKVTMVDLTADNGVVHVIDAVLLPPTTTVVDIIVNSPNHNTLEAAVLAAGLETTLSGDGPFTVFAPTDAAFAALPAGTVDALLADPNGALTDILLYHAVAGEALSGSLTDGQMITTINGKDVIVTINADGVFINDAKVTMVDLTADNGVVHVIDAVLIPRRVTVVDIIVNSPNHNTLEAAVLAAGLETTLSGDGPFTVFAPTDDAFAALPMGTVDALLADPSGLLTDILTYHAVGASALSTDLTNGQRVTTINGRDVVVAINSDGVFINNAKVTMADVTTDNGVVHVIDAVLIPGNTIFDIVAGSADHTTLEAAIRAAGLENALSELETTLYAPNDAAFAKLPAGTVEFLVNNPNVLTDILLLHTLDDVYESTEFNTELSESFYLALNGSVLTIQNDGTTYSVNEIPVDASDIQADNGLVNVISTVILNPDSTIVDVVRGSEDHTILETAIDSLEGGSEVLSSYGPFTLFAPVNDAFSGLSATELQGLLNDEDVLGEILSDHIVFGKALSTDLSDGMVITSAGENDLVVTINSDGVFINNAKVIAADIETDNGVVHVIDQIIEIPAFTVVDVIVNSADHNTLEAAVLAAGLETTLSGEGPFTVFAPTDDAFAALPAGTVDALLADPTGALTDILLYHAVAGEAGSATLSNGQTIMTINGKDVTVTINTDGVFINNAQVTMADIFTDNGVVHVIDAVLLPPSVTVVDVIVNSPDHNTLEAAVLAAGLETTLSGDGPFTVFAPTDAAFAALPAGTVDALLADPTGALTDILLYHAVAGEALSSSLSDGQTIMTVNGQDVTVTINADGVFINNAQVTVADIPADNGVVHVIDAVLLPPTNTVVDIIVNSPDHNTLEAAVLAAGLETTLSGDGPFTVFAPTDAAFAALPAGTVDALLADPTGALTDILLYHAVAGEALSSSLSDGQTIMTVNGQDVTVTINADGVFINNAQVTVADIPADNGVVHVINAVLLPSTSTNDLEVIESNVTPNPVLDRLSYNLSSSTNDIVDIRIFDMTGKVVMYINGKDTKADINISGLNSGTYMIQFNNNEIIARQKIVKL